MCHVLSVSLCLTHIWSEDDFVLVEPCGLESAVLTGPTLSDSCLPVSCLSFYPSGCDPRIDPAVPLCLRSTLRCPSTPTWTAPRTALSSGDRSGTVSLFSLLHLFWFLKYKLIILKNELLEWRDPVKVLALHFPLARQGLFLFSSLHFHLSKDSVFLFLQFVLHALIVCCIFWTLDGCMCKMRLYSNPTLQNRDGIGCRMESWKSIAATRLSNLSHFSTLLIGVWSNAL